MDYFSCSLFDKENICDTFVVKYNQSEGKPLKGDIISVTKINVSLLSDGEHRLFICEETKLLEKGKKFLVSPKKLKSISSKLKLDNKENIYSTKKKKLDEIKNKEIIKEESKEESISSNSKSNLFNEEENGYNYNIINFNSTNSKTNNINTNKKEKNEIKIKSNEKTLKIQPQKKEDFSQKERDMILDTINLFIDDFQDGINVSENINNRKRRANGLFFIIQK